jgi:DNA-binding response OmpR family regulator
LVLLDLALPDIDGLDVCRAIRAQHPGLPIIMLTGRAEETDVVVGLDAGADDYIIKPFGLAELLARIRARLRLTVPASVEMRGVRIDVNAHRAWHHDQELHLTATEFTILALLLRNAGQVVSRRQLTDEIWNTDVPTSTKTLDMHIAGLRKKLHDDPHSPRLITTVRSVGYRFHND